MADWPPLSRERFDRAAHRRGDAEWLAEAWARARVLPVSERGTVPVRRDGGCAADPGRAGPNGAGPNGAGPGGMAVRWASPEEIPADAPRRFLGIADQAPHFSVTVPAAKTLAATVPASTGSAATVPAATVLAGDGWAGLRELGAEVGELDAALVTAAVALQHWHDRHPRCPRCGAPTVEAQAGWVRHCPADGTDQFPRTDPAVIMLVHDGDGHCLLGRGPQWAPGRFSTLAGFVEPGESLEAAVAREVREEVDVAVHDVQYLGSQPWPFPASLMCGFVALASRDGRLRLDPKEMAAAGWFSRDEVRRARVWTDTAQAWTRTDAELTRAGVGVAGAGAAAAPAGAAAAPAGAGSEATRPGAATTRPGSEAACAGPEVAGTGPEATCAGPEATCAGPEAMRAGAPDPAARLRAIPTVLSISRYLIDHWVDELG